MNKKQYELLTPNQVIGLLLGYTTAIEVLSLPNFLVKYANQDAWISAALGGIYPLYLSMLAIYMSSKFPNDNILVLSRKFCGKLLGGILNFIFLTFFIVYYVIATAGFTNLNRVYANPYVTPEKIVIATTLVAAYAAYKGLKTLAKTSEVLYYVLLLIIFSSITALQRGSIENIMPVFQSSIGEILKGSRSAMFSYGGLEAVFLIYPSITDTKKLKGALLKFVLVLTLIYTYITFITVYYLSPDIVTKNLWSFTAVAESLSLSVITSFRFVFIFLFIAISLRLYSNYFYACVLILEDFFKGIPKIRLCALIYPILVYLTLKIPGENAFRNLTNFIMPKYTIFSLLYITLISLLIFFNKGEKNEKNKE